MLEQTWEKIITGQKRGAGAIAVRALLRLGAGLYRFGLWANHWLYDSGLKVRTTPALPTISIGNLTVGGTGKTTAAKFIARHLIDHKQAIQPAIVLRGYGRKSADGPAIVSDGNRILLDLQQAGDEALMLAHALTGCVIAVGKRRESVIELIDRRTDADIVILDDGMQYFRMSRSLEIVLMDALADRRALNLLPAGKLREPLSALRRADQVWITHADLVSNDELQQLRNTINAETEAAPVIETAHRPGTLRPLASSAESLDTIDGANVVAVSGLGNPQSFERSLQECGCTVRPMRFSDHHRYQPADYDIIRQQLEETGADLIVTTEKDAVKLPPPPEDYPRIAVLGCELDILRGEDRFAADLNEMASVVNR